MPTGRGSTSATTCWMSSRLWPAPRPHPPTNRNLHSSSLCRPVRMRVRDEMGSPPRTGPPLARACPTRPTPHRVVGCSPAGLVNDGNNASSRIGTPVRAGAPASVAVAVWAGAPAPVAVAGPISVEGHGPGGTRDQGELEHERAGSSEHCRLPGGLAGRAGCPEVTKGPQPMRRADAFEAGGCVSVRVRSRGRSMTGTRRNENVCPDSCLQVCCGCMIWPGRDMWQWPGVLLPACVRAVLTLWGGCQQSACVEQCQEGDGCTTYKQCQPGR